MTTSRALLALAAAVGAWLVALVGAGLVYVMAYEYDPDVFAEEKQ